MGQKNTAAYTAPRYTPYNGLIDSLMSASAGRSWYEVTTPPRLTDAQLSVALGEHPDALDDAIGGLTASRLADHLAQGTHGRYLADEFQFALACVLQERVLWDLQQEEAALESIPEEPAEALS